MSGQCGQKGCHQPAVGCSIMANNGTKARFSSCNCFLLLKRFACICLAILLTIQFLPIIPATHYGHVMEKNRDTFVSELVRIDMDIWSFESHLDMDSTDDMWNGNGTCPAKAEDRNKQFMIRIMQSSSKFQSTSDPFYPTEGCKIYICYLSHLDPEFKGYNGSIAMQPFMVKNSEHNEVGTICTNDYHDVFHGKKIQPNAWHGVGLISTVESIFDVITSFSNEKFKLFMYRHMMEVKLGTHDSMIAEVEHYEGKRRMPPADFLENIHKAQEAFVGNPGLWLVPLDMGYVSEKNGEKTRLMHLVFRGCGNKMELPGINLSNDKGESYDFDIGDHIVVNIDSNKLCTTTIVNVQPAVIKDTFIELTSICDPKKDKEDCESFTDYAVRLGYLQYEANNDPEIANELFKSALDDWVNMVGTQVQIDAKEEMGWYGFDFLDAIEAGAFRYISITREWYEEGVHMLLHNCQGYGIYASAVRNGTVTSNDAKLEEICKWENDFVFIQDCSIGYNIYLADKEHQYFVRDAPKNYYSKEYRNEIVQFGVVKGEKKNETAYELTPQQIEAHKFKFGLIKPLRIHEPFMDQSYNNSERSISLGRYLAPTDMQYKPRKFHMMEVKFVQIEKENLPYDLDPDLLDFAKVSVAIYQTCHHCNEFKIYTTRMFGLQHVEYKMIGTDNTNSVLRPFQIASYKIDGRGYAPPRLISKPDLRVVFVYDKSTWPEEYRKNE